MNTKLVSAFAIATLLLCAQCETAAPAPQAGVGSGAVDAAWSVVYRVLQHPRCLNCHPSGDAPLQGDDSHVHMQNVQRGENGQGVFAMRCTTCHQTQNLAGEHLPPGAPRWQLPRAQMPLVFQGKSASELCLQLRDPARNGGKTPAQLLQHVTDDPVVLWGWAPGEGRAAVPVPHAEFVRAFRTWVESGCALPQK